MGGVGSGKKTTRTRALVEDCDTLDVSFISRYGFTIYPVLAEIKNDANKECLFIDFNRYITGPRYDYIQKVEIVRTYPHFGGERYWLKCPNCERVIRILYRPESEILFKCRICCDLFYSSQKSNKYDGWLRKTSKGFAMSPKQYEKMVV
jgi:uncharacterized C2H2 Zn-finger protein